MAIEGIDSLRTLLIQNLDNFFHEQEAEQEKTQKDALKAEQEQENS